MYTILGTDYCHWCMKAKMLLQYKKLPYKYLDVNQEIYYKEYLIPGVMNHKTIPKIIYNKKFIGGFEDMLNHIKKMEKKNKRKKSKKKRKTLKRR